MEFLAWGLIPVFIFIGAMIVGKTASWAVNKNELWSFCLYAAIALPVLALTGAAVFFAFAYPLAAQ